MCRRLVKRRLCFYVSHSNNKFVIAIKLNPSALWTILREKLSENIRLIWYINVFHNRTTYKKPYLRAIGILTDFPLLSMIIGFLTDSVLARVTRMNPSGGVEEEFLWNCLWIILIRIAVRRCELQSFFFCKNVYLLTYLSVKRVGESVFGR